MRTSPPRRSRPILPLLAAWGAGPGCTETNRYLVSAGMFELHPSTFQEGNPGALDTGSPEAEHSPRTTELPAGDTGEAEEVEPTDTGERGGGLAEISFTRVPGDIWSNLIPAGNELHVATVAMQEVRVLPVTPAHELSSEAVVLMRNEPVPGFQVTDISTVRVGNHFIVAASNPEATELVVGSYALDGRVLVAPRLVVVASSVPTNDMQLVVRAGELYLFFGGDGVEKQVVLLDDDLEVRSGPFAFRDPANSSQMGCVVATEDGFLRVAGNHRNHGLVRTTFTPSWTTDDEDAFALPIPTRTDEWRWFSTGCIQDPKTGDWYIAHQFMRDGDSADEQSAIELSHLTEDWQHRETIRVSAPMGYTRPQLALLEDDLFLSFDRAAGDVQLGRLPLDPGR